MDEVDVKILDELKTKGIPLDPEPFNPLAEKLKISTVELIERISKLQEKGIIRRFGASIRPTHLGFFANALVAWKVPENRIQEIGTYLAKFKEITHCYHRRAVAGVWEYNLYTVMHGKERKGVEEYVSGLSKSIEIKDYVILYSLSDLKKADFSNSSTEKTEQTSSLYKKVSGGKFI